MSSPSPVQRRVVPVLPLLGCVLLCLPLAFAAPAFFAAGAVKMFVLQAALVFVSLTLGAVFALRAR